jgi:hypothetical protein
MDTGQIRSLGLNSGRRKPNETVVVQCKNSIQMQRAAEAIQMDECSKLPPLVAPEQKAASLSVVPIRSRFGLRISMGVRARYEAVLSPADQQRIKSGRRRRTVSGHCDHFLWDQSKGHLFKKAAPLEIEAYAHLSQDTQDPIVPLISPYGGVVMIDGEKYLTLADLLHDFDSPSVMDIKLGSRTFLESTSCELREDLYKKLKKLGVNHLITDEEKTAEKCTKIRYLHLRDCISSSASEGFRIEGILHGNHVVDEINFKTLCARDKIVEAIKCFLAPQKNPGAEQGNDLSKVEEGDSEDEATVLTTQEGDMKGEACSVRTMAKGGAEGGGDASKAMKVEGDEQSSAAEANPQWTDTCRACIARLTHIREQLVKSNFFRTHQFVGTSLLFAKDAKGQVGVWVIDFGKTTASTIPITHSLEWEMGNEEDGYLIGLDNLRDCFVTALGDGVGGGGVFERSGDGVGEGTGTEAGEGNAEKIGDQNHV